MIKRCCKTFICLTLVQSIFVLWNFQQASCATVTTGQLKETSITYNRKKEKVFCLKTVPGTITTRSKTITFTPFSTTLSRTSRSSTSKYNRLKALVSLGTKECKRIAKVNPGTTPSPTGTPEPGNTASPTPRPTATPTPEPLTGNFDLQGNVTPAGKLLFGIPSSLTANVTAGKAAQAAKCSGCHLEKTGRTFMYVRTSIQRSPMLYDEAQIPDPMLANLVAYLNRFRP